MIGPKALSFKPAELCRLCNNKDREYLAMA
jgi:hypothetical protein